MNKPIYLDYAATTHVIDEIADIVMHYMCKDFGNASSIDHRYGQKAKVAIGQAKKQVANLCGGSPRNVVFTSGATESINIILQGFIKKLSKKKEKITILSSPTEHSAVLDTLKFLEKNEVEIRFADVNSHGSVSLASVSTHLQQDIDLVCLMAANNETGNLNNIKEIAKRCQEYKTPFFCDATQQVGKLPIDIEGWGISAISLSAHKIYGPKGVGALLLNDGLNYADIEPITFGGGQQKGLRVGTLNVAGIAGLSLACELAQARMKSEKKRLNILRELFLKKLNQSQINFHLNTDLENSLPGYINLSIAGVFNKQVLKFLENEIAISTGSACSSGLEQASHVLRAMNLSEELLQGCFRFSFGLQTSEDDVCHASEKFIDVASQLSPLGKFASPVVEKF